MKNDVSVFCPAATATTLRFPFLPLLLLLLLVLREDVLPFADTDLLGAAAALQTSNDATAVATTAAGAEHDLARFSTAPSCDPEVAVATTAAGTDADTDTDTHAPDSLSSPA